MAGGGINVYFGENDRKIIERMEKGELSKVCQQAVSEWDSYSESLEILERKLSVIEEEKNKIVSKHGFIKKRYDKLKGEKEAVEQEELRKKERKLKGEKERLENVRRTFFETATDFGLSKKEKEEQFPDFLEQWERGRESGKPCLGALAYLPEKNPGRTWKKKK